MEEAEPDLKHILTDLEKGKEKWRRRQQESSQLYMESGGEAEVATGCSWE